MDRLLEKLRELYIGCDIEVNQLDDTFSPWIPAVTSKGPIESIDRDPNGAVVVTVRWWGEKDFRKGAIEYVAVPPSPITVRINENFREDTLGRLILFRLENDVTKETVVFFGKQRGNMNPAKVRGIHPKFLPN